MTEFAKDTNVPVKTDYISREAAKGAVCLSGVHMSHRIVICNMISAIPAAEVRHVVRGEWITKHMWDWFVCSCCSFESNSATNFCPHCGADMRGKEDEDNVYKPD